MGGSSDVPQAVVRRLTQPKIFFLLNFVFLQIFGWDLKSLWQTANSQLCISLIRAGKYAEGFELYLSMMEASNETTKASTRAWFAGESPVMTLMLRSPPALHLAHK
jgi:hypothetical protein